MSFRVLGCGSSTGVPSIAGDWGGCDCSNIKNRRRRPSFLVTRKSENGKCTRVLVDTGPDLREQLLSARVDWVDGVFYTHAHADHTHGINDLRPIAIKHDTCLSLYMDEKTTSSIRSSFGYCFKNSFQQSKTEQKYDYPPIASANIIRSGSVVTVDGSGGSLVVLPYNQVHGGEVSLGFRFGKVAYSTDLSYMLDEAMNALVGLDVLIIGALRWTVHKNHFSVDQALRVIERLTPKRAFLTHMHVDLDYDSLRRYLPAYVEPAYDDLEFSVQE